MCQKTGTSNMEKKVMRNAIKNAVVMECLKNIKKPVK